MKIDEVIDQPVEADDWAERCLGLLQRLTVRDVRELLDLIIEDTPRFVASLADRAETLEGD